MNEPISAQEELACRVLAREAAETDPSSVRASQRAIEKLRLYLTKFIGAAGFHSMLTRALALAKVQRPGLASVQVNPDGTLAGIDDAAQVRGGGAAEKAEAAVLTQLLALLVVFIGANMTLHIVQNIWSGTRLDDLNFDAGEKI